MIEVNLVPVCFVMLGVAAFAATWLYLQIRDDKKRQKNLDWLMSNRSK